MPGLLVDVNVQGHLPYLKRMLDKSGLLTLLVEIGITFETLPERGLDRQINDRDLWKFCQANDLVLFTENRNHDDEDSLNATLLDSWRPGLLPILTLANKGRFENSPRYAAKVAEDVADQLFCIFQDNIRDRPRIFIPI